MAENNENNTSPPSSESLSVGEKILYSVLAVLVLCIVGYSLITRSADRGDSAWRTASRSATPSTPEPEWPIPQEWMEIPELVRRGTLEQAEQRLANVDTTAERPPEQAYILGLLAAYLSDTDSAGQLLSQASTAQPARIEGISSDAVEVRMGEMNLTSEELYRTKFNLEDAQYVARAFVYRCIAEGILKDVPPGIRQAEALVGWIRRNIAPFEPHAHNALPVIIMARGYGLADRMCWAMLAIAAQKGIPGMMVHLFDAEKKTSPHTICQVFCGDVAVLCDPYHGIVFRRSDGSPLDLYYARRDPTALAAYPPYAEGLSQYIKHALVRFWPIEAQAVYPRMKFLEGYAKRLPLAPVLYQDMDTLNAQVNHYLISLPNGSSMYNSVSPAVAVHPFQVLHSFRDESHLAYLSAYMEPYRAINQARLLHLKGAYRPAYEQYSEAINVELPPETQELAALFRAQCLYELRNYDESRDEFEAFLEKYPNTRWRNQVEYYFRLIDQKKNRVTEQNSEQDAQQ